MVAVHSNWRFNLQQFLMDLVKTITNLLFIFYKYILDNYIFMKCTRIRYINSIGNCTG